jgi:hypothetical protein
LGDVFTECVQGCIGKRNLCIGCFRHYVMNGLLYRLPPTFNMDIFKKVFYCVFVVRVWVFSLYHMVQGSILFALFL